MFGRKSTLERCVDGLNRVAGPLALVGTVVAVKAYDKAESLEEAIPQLIAQSATAASVATVKALNAEGKLALEKPEKGKKDEKVAAAK